MFLARFGAVWLLVAVFLGGCAGGARPTAGPAPPDLAIALQRGLPYAVGVYAVGGSAAVPARIGPLERPEPDGPEIDDAVGAGIVMSADGLIATAAHVIADAEQIVVVLWDGRILPAQTVGVDADADIALLRVDARWPAEPPFGHSIVLRPGDRVLAVGEPYGLSRSAVAGIVSGDTRHFIGDRDLMFLQTDIALNPGDSGGPLFDDQGRIVAMNLRSVVGMYGMAGLGLSVPIEVVRQIAAGLASGRPPWRPQLGAHFEDLTPPEAFVRGLARVSGALVRRVDAGGVGARIDLRADDVIVGMNGRPVDNGAELSRLLLEWSDAAELRLTVFRAGAYRELRLPR
jgi:serine protease Do